MTKKLMVLAAGALAALAFMAIPSIATAGEVIGTCSSGATCTGTVEGTGHATLEESGGLRVTCTATSGTATQMNNSSTGTGKFVFTGCTESIFGTQCTNTVTNGKIETNTMVSHNVILEKEPKVVGVLLTNANVTFNCPAVFSKKTVTGNLIGEIVNPECGVAKTKSTFNFAAGATTGSQKWTQVTTTGTVFDLTTNNDAGGAYATSSQTGIGHINWAAGSSVKLDC